ncbi:WLM domain-containing protein [Chaetomium fimeti]|uniref:WLM domain-containing protein n=1 Tax=Chaetomium fimeti TaxID=1854472 RepID=A0AAE0HQJ9_9PEZI|nr:WLM domain-containing protein [Chaetomium fimeti]
MSQSSEKLIGYYTHLNLPRHEEALWHLTTIASLVKPIMRAHGWKLGMLSEMYPEDEVLLGENLNREQILVRLREPRDRNEFLPLDKMVNTMLHELSHMQCWGHDDIFYDMWDSLRLEFDRLLRSGYTGKVALGIGRPGGGPGSEDLPSYGALEPRGPGFPSGNRSGAAPSTLPDSLLAPSFRNSFSQSISRGASTADIDCHNGGKLGRELQTLMERWTKEKFKTWAEESSAKDAAALKALWDLLTRDSRGGYGPGSSRRVGGSSSFLPSQDLLSASRDTFSASRNALVPSRDTFAASLDPFPTPKRIPSTTGRDPFDGFSDDLLENFRTKRPPPQLKTY